MRRSLRSSACGLLGWLCCALAQGASGHAELTVQGNGYEAARRSFVGLQYKWDRQEALARGLMLDMEVELQMAGLPRYDAADLRELSITYDNGPWQLRAGASRVFWGVTESRHLVDVVNQLDQRFDPDGDVRLSQPMIVLGYRQPGRTVTLFALPCHRERQTTLMVTPGDDAAYYDSLVSALRCDGAPGFALRASQVAGPADLGLSLFQGPAREPYGGRQTEPQGDPYARVQRAAFDGQVTQGPWLLKLEALLQDSERGSDQAAVAGFEYTWPSALGGASDLSLLVEHLVDSRCDSLVAACGEMLGARWLANDSVDSNLLVSAVRDRPSGRLGLKIQGSRRIDEQLSLLLNSGGIHRAKYISIGLSYAF